jgi:hypothetical protein
VSVTTWPVPHGWLAHAVYALDRLLRRQLGVFEYSSEPGCIFRLEVRRLERPVKLRDGPTFAAGERIVQLHFWNEHVPEMPPQGATLDWARRMSKRVDTSLRELARFMKADPAFADVVAVRARMALATTEQSAQLVRICNRYGMRPVVEPERPSLLGRLHRAGENVLVALLVLARNPQAFRLDCLRRARTDVFLPRSTLDARYCAPGALQP